LKLKLFKQIVAAAVIASTLAASAQTLTITNGVQKYASLTSTTANLSGRCELWLTNSTPLAGCTINLNSLPSHRKLKKMVGNSQKTCHTAG